MSKSSNAFSNRVMNNARIATWRPKGAPQYSLAVDDQLLVSPLVVNQVLAWLKVPSKGKHPSPALPGAPASGYKAGVIATVFQGLDLPYKQDIAIVKIDNLPAAPINGQPPIFGVANALRARLPKQQRFVSPNHVLVPAPVGAGCPAGPPHPSPELSPSLPSVEPAEVTVIDSGYLDYWQSTSPMDTFGDTWGPWGSNPLDAICTLEPIKRADWLLGSKPLGALLAALPAGLGANPNANPTWWQGHPGWWSQSTPDMPATQQKRMLDALAGHANFVAGVIAQNCEHPTLRIWSHNGSFVVNSDQFPCEASVCRSIVMSQLAHQTPVIHVGFAFALTPNAVVPASVANSYLSVVWDRTFALIGPNHVLIAPAGNETDTNPYFPAGLNWALPGHGFSNVVGVASLQASNVASTFSNTGSSTTVITWVHASAKGEGVQSTFVPVHNVTCEDDPLGPSGGRPMWNFDPDGWATWDGTSFAAPRVAADLATRLGAPGATPSGALTAFDMTYPVLNPALGHELI
jgi:hypothetical protein